MIKMEFFDKLTKKATETYKGAAEKTSKLAKETKLKMKISDNKSKIDELYKEIGKKVYQKHVSKDENCIKDQIAEELLKIDNLSSEIDSYHDQILELSNEKVCINCKEPMDKAAKFCPKCGAEQPIQEEETAKEVEVLGVENQEESQEVNQNEEPSETNQEETSQDKQPQEQQEEAKPENNETNNE